jgi:hypothetical protein
VAGKDFVFETELRNGCRHNTVTVTDNL